MTTTATWEQDFNQAMPAFDLTAHCARKGHSVLDSGTCDCGAVQASDLLDLTVCGSGHCDPQTGCPSCNDDGRVWTRAR